MNKAFLTTVALLMMMGTIVADEKTPQMLVNEKTGNSTSYDISSVQKITFENGNAMVYRKSASSSSYSISAVRSITFSNLPDYEKPDIDTSVDNTGAGLTFLREGNNLIVNGAEKSVLLYSATGMLISSTNPSNGQVSINLAELQHGTYLLRSGNQTMKFNY